MKGFGLRQVVIGMVVVLGASVVATESQAMSVRERYLQQHPEVRVKEEKAAKAQEQSAKAEAAKETVKSEQISRHKHHTAEVAVEKPHAHGRHHAVKAEAEQPVAKAHLHGHQKHHVAAEAESKPVASGKHGRHHQTLAEETPKHPQKAVKPAHTQPSTSHSHHRRHHAE